jgi:NAD(P)-dependent dehydrogenase (short-subunit alcohol dehydrogenase family)
MASALAFDLTNKVALITGSSRGIGEAIARQMARHGARVIISSRKPEACRAVADDINAQAGRATAVAIPCHIGQRSQLEELVRESQSQLGSIDILVCNAAVNPYFGPMASLPESALDKVLDCNIKANHQLCQLVLPDMQHRRSGAIIIVSSIAGLYGHATAGAYSISKAADMQLARNIAVEYGPYNIRANSIAPGLIKTDFSKALWSDGQLLATATERIALRHIGEPEDVAGAAVFLASHAARYITAQTLVIDGGLTGL